MGSIIHHVRTIYQNPRCDSSHSYPWCDPSRSPHPRMTTVPALGMISLVPPLGAIFLLSPLGAQSLVPCALGAVPLVPQVLSSMPAATSTTTRVAHVSCSLC